MDLLGDIAGIAELVKSFIGLLIFKISKISFYISAMKKLFLVKYQKNNTFDQKMIDEGDTLEEKLSHLEMKGVQKWISTNVTEDVENKKLKE